jgi:lipooligosaccharide transport system permease protein
MSATSLAIPRGPRLTLAVLRRHLRVWRRGFVSGLVVPFSQPLFYLLALGFGLGALLPGVGGLRYLDFIAPGLVVSTALFGATQECTRGSFSRLVTRRLFEGMLATPVSVTDIVIGEILFATLKATVASAAVLAVVAMVGGTPSPTAALAPLVAGLAGVLFAQLALWVTALSPSGNAFPAYEALAITPMLLFSGIFFPLDALPPWVRMATWFNPLTHATDAARALFNGHFDAGLALDLGWLCAAAALPLAWVRRLMQRRLIR